MIEFGSAYLSQRLDHQPDNLAEVAAQWHRGLLPVPGTRQYVRVSKRLWLASTPLVAAAGGTQLYEVRGVVWIGLRPVPLTLEFTKWSDTQSEIGVGPRCLSWPVGTERYARRVRAALEAITQVLSLSTRQVSVPSDVVADADVLVAASESRVRTPERSMGAFGPPSEVRAGPYSSSSRRGVLVPVRPLVTSKLELSTRHPGTVRG